MPLDAARETQIPSQCDTKVLVLLSFSAATFPIPKRAVHAKGNTPLASTFAQKAYSALDVFLFFFLVLKLIFIYYVLKAGNAGTAVLSEIRLI